MYNLFLTKSPYHVTGKRNSQMKLFHSRILFDNENTNTIYIYIYVVLNRSLLVNSLEFKAEWHMQEIKQRDAVGQGFRIETGNFPPNWVK